jgi:hypothetical protein
LDYGGEGKRERPTVEVPPAEPEAIGADEYWAAV